MRGHRPVFQGVGLGAPPSAGRIGEVFLVFGGDTSFRELCHASHVRTSGASSIGLTGGVAFRPGLAGANC